MRDTERIKAIFDAYKGVMRTKELSREKIYYADIEFLIKNANIEKIRTGYYQWVDDENFGEINTVKHLFPDGILCMDTALWHYRYSDRTPAEWHLAVDKYANRTRFNIDYPFVKPYYVSPTCIDLGVCEQEIDGYKVQMYDRERVICDCIRHRNKMDREIFNKAIRHYVDDNEKNIPRLTEYATKLKCMTAVRNIVGVWL